jgi:hypothetical protein
VPPPPHPSAAGSRRPWSRLPKYEWRYWETLHLREQWQVLRLARRRRVHPDTAVREAAAFFAAQTHYSWRMLPGLLIDGYPGLGDARVARRIRRAERAQGADGYPLD